MSLRNKIFLQSYICILSMVLSGSLFSQSEICDGNLGNNIFESGDFGSGIPNIVPVDPQIAPGYQYTQTGPPPDL